MARTSFGATRFDPLLRIPAQAGLSH